MRSIAHPPTPVSRVDWVTGETTYDVSQMDASQLWRTAVACAATNARKALPECTTRIDKAIELVLNDAVELLDTGTASVTSQQGGTTAYYVVNGTCECADFPKAPQQHCKHRLARGLAVRAREIATELGQAASPITLGLDDLVLDQTPVPVPEPATTPVSIPQQFLVSIQGKQFVTFQGLLHLAHEQGLLSLSARFIRVTAALALAEATAMFHDGRTFTEAADSTPTNVNSRIKPHFPRMALTRAKARCLRYGLNLAYVCAEELV